MTTITPAPPTLPAPGAAGKPAGIGARVRDAFTSPKYGPVLVTAVLFVAVFVAGGVRYPGFLSGQVLLNLFVDNAYLIVLAVG
ncbi:MAG TPA: sugar ABC transporter permease YjfF, partial [Agromyces sp.]